MENIGRAYIAAQETSNVFRCPEFSLEIGMNI